MIPKEVQMEKKQDVSHVKVFGSIVSVLIPKEKRYKSDIYKNQREIFIEYSQDITKHVRAWALKTQQILLVTNPYIDKSEQGAKLLVDYSLDLTYPIAVKQKGPIGKSRPRGKPQKIQAIENISITLVLELKETADTSTKETENLELNPNIENQENVTEKAMSATKISSKIHEPATYKETISDLIHS